MRFTYSFTVAGAASVLYFVGWGCKVSEESLLAIDDTAEHSANASQQVIWINQQKRTELRRDDVEGVDLDGLGEGQVQDQLL